MEPLEKENFEQLSIEELYQLCSDQERMFVDYYIIDPNKAKAARVCGFNSKTAGQCGYNVYHRPKVKTLIGKLLKERTLQASEVVKLISDTAQTNLSDYYKMRMVPYTPRVKRPLSEVIQMAKDELEEMIDFRHAKFFPVRPKFDNRYLARLASKEDEIISLEVQLNRNPDAYRIMNGETEMVEEWYMDVAALVADKENGRIKSFKTTKYGLEVELYSALDAQEKLMRMHGQYEKDNRQLAAKVIRVMSEEDADS